MAYQVLARKWRPHSFKDLVGQEHVLQALVHSLEKQRLHHAYLFTGTRGVGKTTIGRILARCLNCETGITPEPCGICSSCTEVLEGRFVDLIEIDAASRTKVEDMRELLDNVQYSPTRGRFKIYLIDEVHMLSNSSFNALLKTLEEPPEHVKFLFATTDPQKLPVTILSRCLQFNLKRMSPERIVRHLRHILEIEAIPTEEAALWQLARAADGSMRDALSLTDQAIAFGNQRIEAAGVSTMLGTINQQNVYRLINALVAGDTSAVLAEIGHMAEFSPDYRSVLAELLATFHRIALEQAVPGSADNSEGDAEQVTALAAQLSAEDVQLFYQTALMSRKDLEVTPDARMGFEMALLRMLAFRPGPPAARPADAVQKSVEAAAVKAPTESRPGPDETPEQEISGADGSAPIRTPQAVTTSQDSAASAPAATQVVAPQITASPRMDEQAGQPAESADTVKAESGLTPRGGASDQSAGQVAAPHAEPQRTSQMSAQSPHQPQDRPPWEDEAVPIDAYSDQPPDESQSADALDPGQDPGKNQDQPQEFPTRAEPLSGSQTKFQAEPQAEPKNPKPEPTQPSPMAESGQERIASQSPAQNPNESLSQGPANAAVENPDPGAGHVPGPASHPDFDWTRDFDQLPINGMPKTLASNGALAIEGTTAMLTLAEGQLRLLNDRHQERLLEALQSVYPDLTRLQVECGEAGEAAPAIHAAKVKAARQAAAVEAIHQDPNVKEFLSRFGGEVVEDSIQPL